MDTDKPRISLLYTSARLGVIQSVLEAWRASANDWAGVEVILVTDDPFELEFPNLRYLQNRGRRDCVTGWNLAASHARGDLFVQVSDDLFPPRGWDSALLQMTAGRDKVSLLLPDERGVVAAVFHPVLSKSVYDHFGYLYPPDFRSMFCDCWLYYAHLNAGFLGVMKQGRFWNHRHRTTHPVDVDDVTREHEADERYQEGRATLKRELDKLGIEVDFGEA